MDRHPDWVNRVLDDGDSIAFYDEAADGLIDQGCPRIWADNYVQTFVRGATETVAELLLRILAKRGFTVSDDLREAVQECFDPQQLYEWFDAALTADSLEAIFDWSFDLEGRPDFTADERESVLT